MINCSLCPNNCGVNRAESTGACGVKGIKIAKYYLHPFEEPCISLGKGSGTVFFSGCSLRCVFCQNYSVSHGCRGIDISVERLSEIFRELEEMGAENINLVNPTHFCDKIAQAFEIYRPNIPVVYNTHGYEKIETLELANSFTDIYLPDLKFFSPDASKRYCGKSDYFSVATKAIEFMNKSRKTSFNGEKMVSGVIVRHLILPLNTSDSVQIVKWYKDNVSDNARLSVMAQYTPYGEISAFPELQRPITAREYEKVYSKLIELGIDDCYIQQRSSASESFIPDWDY